MYRAWPSIRGRRDYCGPLAEKVYAHGESTMADNVPLFMRRNALRLQKLVNTLLEFSRVQAGRAHASFAAVDLTALTSDLASSVRSAILVRDLVLMHGGRIDVASELGSGSVFTVAIPLGARICHRRRWMRIRRGRRRPCRT